MLRFFLSLVILSGVITGCSTNLIEPDNTPLAPTAVIERHLESNGIKGFFPFEDNELHYVRPNMRRDDNSFKGTGTYSSFLVGSRSGSTISRIDRNLLWSLNTKKEEYTECPLKGCIDPAKKTPTKNDNVAKPPEAKHDSGCTMEVAHTSFTVKPNGQKKSINGFDTDEYLVAWIIKLRDKTGRTSTSTLNVEAWTTPLTQAMRDTFSMEEKYAKAYAGTIPSIEKQPIVPSEATKIIAAYMANSLASSSRNAFLDAGKQLGQIKGYPISTRLTWNLDGNACAAKEPKSTDNDSSSSSSISTSSPGGLVSSLAGMLVQKKTEENIKNSESEPLLSFTIEVKSLKLESLHDSIFTVPKNYRLVTQP
jgi:hypothetical protein